MNKTKTNKPKMNQISRVGKILSQELFHRADDHCMEPLALQAYGASVWKEEERRIPALLPAPGRS